MNPIDNNINKLLVEKKLKNERLNIQKKLQPASKNRKSQKMREVPLKKPGENVETNYIYKQFINYNNEISKTIHLKDTLETLSDRIANTHNFSQIKQIVENYINNSTFKGDKILKNYETFLRIDNEKDLTNSVSRLLSSTEHKLKRLNVIIQNFDSIVNHKFYNTTNILHEIINFLSKTQNSKIENLISNIQGERVVQLLKG